MNTVNVLKGVIIGFVIGFGGGYIVVERTTGIPIPQSSPLVTCNYSMERDGVLIKVNELRITNRLPQLKTDPVLEEYATLKVKEIATTKNLQHTSRYGTIFKWATDYNKPEINKYINTGENLAGQYSDPCEAVMAWNNSPTHRDAILNPKFVNIGVAVNDGYAVIELGELKE